MKQALALLRALHAGARCGGPGVLVTLTDVFGSAARAPGEHMAVFADGRALGSFSGGCVEAAVIAEARDVLTAGQERHVRYGVGSRYIDIRLPCGGGIDLHFLPAPDADHLERAIGILERRRPVTMRLGGGGLVATEAGEADRTGWCGDAFVVRHDPALRLVVMGHGAEPRAMLDIARAYGAETVLFSPQASLVEDARVQGSDARLLKIVGLSEDLPIDQWSAVISLFHDHDWETSLLVQALEKQPFFIGAMGSVRTHAERRHRLEIAGADPRLIDRVNGPVGLIKATRDPFTLAISVMAHVVAAYEAMIAARTQVSASMSKTQGVDEDTSGGKRRRVELSLGGNSVDDSPDRHARRIAQ